MIDTEKGKADVSRFAIDLAIRIALLAGVVYGSLQLLRPIIPTLLWAVILWQQWRCQLLALMLVC